VFFLRGVSATALAATQTARDILALLDNHRSDVAKNAKALTRLDHLFRYPTVSVNSVRKRMDCTFPTASKLITDFASRGWLLEVTGNERHRIWRYRPYLNLSPGITSHHDCIGTPAKPEPARRNRAD
jgi:hypothetical protein